METENIIILCACASAEEAATIARALLAQRLVACAHIPPAGRSLYWWKGDVVDSGEVYALFKTRKGLFAEVEAAIKGLHSYEVPCVISWDMAQGHAPFMEWISAETVEPPRR